MDKKKPVCKFGSKCYRKNPQHLKDFYHPSDSNESGPSADALQKDAEVEGGAQHRVSGSEDSDGSGGEDLEESTSPTTKRRSNASESEDSDRGGHDCPLPKRRKTDDGAEKADVETSSADDEPGGADGRGKDVGDGTEPEEESGKGDGENQDGREVVDLPEDPKAAVEALFLVKMPKDFFHFWDCAKSIDAANPSDAFKAAGLRLVGPFDVLAGRFKNVKESERDAVLRHWRYYYDPPEFQTLIASTDKGSELHLGYWRDAPDSKPVFVAENDAKKDGKFKRVEENIFGAVVTYLHEALSKADTFKKTKIEKLLKVVKKFAEDHKWKVKTDAPRNLAKRPGSVANPFHGLGLVVPYDKKTDVGYREIPETTASLRRMFQKVVSSDPAARDRAMEPIDELITNVQFANDEGDPGMGLELGLNAFAFGGEALHGVCENVLGVTYMLLGRHAFRDILKAHLKCRKKGSDLSVV